MSKQPQEQDEQQSPSGAARGGVDPATSGSQDEAPAGKAGASSRRSRRRGRGGGNASGPAARARAEEAATTPAPVASGPAGGTAQAEAGASAAASSAASPGQADKAGADKPGADKPAAGKPGAGQGGGSTPAGSGQGGGAGGGKAGVIALVLVLIVIAGLAFIGWQGWRVQQALAARLDQLKENTPSLDRVQALAGRLESGENERNAALDEAVSSLRGDFGDYRRSVDETLDKVLEELSSEQQTDERDWLHAEAAYLLRLANQRLQLERDVQGAAALLRTADDRLREADNPALVPVRREIASELAALESVPRVDRTGLYLALYAQQEQIAGRPLAQDIEQIAASSSIVEAPSGGWQQQLSRFGAELKDLVTVRKHDEALEALISPEQESYLRQSVRLVLEQAQLALLKEEQELYDASLDKALTLIRGYYDTDDSGVQSVIARLEELRQRPIRPELPDISGSQQALASFIEHRFETGDGGQGDEA